MDERERQPFDDIATAGAPATPDALRQIVARHQRARTRTLGALLAVALVAGPAAGWALGHSGGGGQEVATSSNQQTPTAANAPSAGQSSAAGVIAFPGGAEAPKATHLFTRTTADGITIRAYRMDPPAPPAGATTSSTTPGNDKETICPKPMTVKPGAPPEAGASSSGAATGPEPPASVVTGAPPPPCAPGAPPICKAAPSVLAEVSSDAAVGQSFDPIDDKQPTDALAHLTVSGFGVPEGSPAIFVTAQTGAGVATVRLRPPAGAADQMAPSGGVAVLALGGARQDGTVVEALDSNGNVLQSMPLTQPGPERAIACGFAVGPNVARPAPATPPTTR